MATHNPQEPDPFSDDDSLPSLASRNDGYHSSSSSDSGGGGYGHRTAHTSTRPTTIQVVDPVTRQAYALDAFVDDALASLWTNDDEDEDGEQDDEDPITHQDFRRGDRF
jgi:hypothetical protein